ncbi:MAG: NADH-quinone oxidoreductase subunit L [Actinomycetota bacterium]
MIHYAWVIAAVPLASAILIFFFGKRLPGGGAYIGVAALAAAVVMSLAVLWTFVQHGDAPAVSGSVYWFTTGPLVLRAGQFVDGLTAVMLVVVTTVSLCVHVYSIGYMKDDVRYTWFYVVIGVFTAAMLNVVIANNIFQLLVGWEVMGICSYLLIGHWYEDKVNSNAAIKAFITTRTGDVFFLFGIFALVTATHGATNIQAINSAASNGTISHGWLIAAALLLFGGVVGKSAQFPLYVWLPDAMAGPTPVSALIHAATMVAAGVYFMGRMFAVFVNAGSGVLQFIAIIAGITMLAAALLAMIQDDIKRVLAYSTISQLGYMVAGLSMGTAGFTPGLFHLFTHAFFKALLFLGAGSVIHSVHSNNMSDMGGLRKSMPITFWTFVIGAAALSGIPPFAGFWSKDEIISTAFREGHYVLWAVALVTAVLTAFYMMRVVLLTFLGDYRGHAHPHESPATMTAPLILLAALSAGIGLIGAPQLNAVFANWVHFGAVSHTEPFEYGFAAVSLVGAGLGLLLGYRVYNRYRTPDPLRALGPAYGVLENKYYLDDFYLRGIVRPTQYPIARGVDWFNTYVIDGVVNGAAALARGLGKVVDVFDRRGIDGAVNTVGETAGFTGGLLKYLQSGNVQRYAVFLFAGVAILAFVFTRV